MNITFIDSDPQKKARPFLDDLLSKGGDQIAIACAFCTGAGVELLLKHSIRLKQTDSFVVVSWRRPTDFDALEKLHAAIPGHLYVHFGADKPEEFLAGPALMHSKIFYARNDTKCWLWTGSHNLTGSASQGLNCEAAILLEGHAEEKPFADAISHLIACRDGAQLFEPGMKGPPGEDIPSNTTLIIHAECGVNLSLPPWHVELRMIDAQLDKILAPPGEVRLYLYSSGALVNGWQNAVPTNAFTGTISGLNFMPSHPRATGLVADWERSSYAIHNIQGVPVMGAPCSPPASTLTQCIFRIEGQCTEDELWLTEKPKARTVHDFGTDRLIGVDEDMKRFFKPSSIHGNNLVYRPIANIRQSFEVPLKEVRKSDLEKTHTRLQHFSSAELKFIGEESSISRPGIHNFIFRRKYRL